MKSTTKTLASLVLGSALLATPALVRAGDGCEKESESAKATTPKGRLKELKVEEVAKLIKRNEATVLDANSPETRSSLGVVPGARLLTNYASYDVAKELPAAKDGKLVFYCGGTACRAADGAAVRAQAAGYKDVAVMRGGITGWKKAGQPVAQPTS